MSLDRDLEAIARLALHLPEAERVALAGGGAMLVHGLVTRPTQDIDLFTPDPAELARLVPALVAALRQQGYDVHLDRSTPTFTRLQVTTPAGRVLVVDLGQDWRMRAPVELDVGRVLHVEETAADKVLALFDRATARDLIDVDALTRHYSHDRLLALAAEKDPGFDRAVFADALGVAAGRDESSFAVLGLTAQQVTGLRERALHWRARLRSAKAASGRTAVDLARTSSR